MKPLVAGNWKMHHGPDAARGFCEALSAGLAEAPVQGAELMLFPSAVALEAVAARVAASGLPVRVGAQTVHAEASGAYTGELAAEMAVEAGATWSLVGHSERRHVFGESDTAVAARVSACLRAGLRPMICVGETIEERKAGRLEEVLARQLEAILPAIGETDPADWALAYEPVWAIGTGETASPEDARDAHLFLRTVLDRASLPAPRILYGGSVKPGNAEELLATEAVDGVLVGGASLEAESFLAIARASAAD